MEENIIECRNLTHYYGSRMIYENLSFSVPRGRILGLLGKNGTGKTTTINILSGYLQPRSGECLIFGEDIQRMDPLTRRRIALLIEGHVQYAFMTVGFLSGLEPGSLLRTDPQVEDRSKTAYCPDVVRPAFAGSPRTDPGTERRIVSVGRLLDGT